MQTKKRSPCTATACDDAIRARAAALGLRSTTALFRHIAGQPGSRAIRALVRGNRSPFTARARRTGEVVWTNAALALSSALRCEPEDLFPELLVELTHLRPVPYSPQRESLRIFERERLTRAIAPPDVAYARAERSAYVRELLHTLSPPLYQVMALRYLDDEGVVETAAMLHLGERRTQYREQRALFELRKFRRPLMLRALFDVDL